MPTLFLPAGQLNVKGPQSPTGVDRWISAVGGITLTGLALTLAIAISVPAGAITITGNANVEDSSFATAGHVAWTGLAPTVSVGSVGTTIALPAGAITWQGLIQTVRLGDLIIEVPAGSLVIKGPARPQVVTQPLAGALTYQGLVLIASVNTPGSAISLQVGSLVITGQTPTREVALPAIAIPAGALTLTGQYVGIQFMQPSVGSLVWQGLAPTITGTQAVGIDIGRGNERFTGLAPVVFIEVIIPIPAGVLAWTAPAMDVGATGQIAVPAGSLVYTGTSSTAHLVWTLPAGSLTLTGTTLAPGHGYGLQAGTLRFTGTAVDLISGDRISAPPAGVLAFTGRLLTLVRTTPTVDFIYGRGSREKRIAGRGSSRSTIPGKGSV